MSIESIKMALNVLQDIHPGNMTPMAEETWHKVSSILYDAIQQAESEPVANMPHQTHGMNLGERIKHVGGVVADDGRVLFGSPMAVDALILQVLRDNRHAPGVPDDVVRDAERYRWLRDRDHWPAPFASSQDPEPVRGIDLDAAIDAAILALRPVQVPMTDEDIFNAYCKSDSTLNTHITNLVAFARAVEAHHGITAQGKKETP